MVPEEACNIFDPEIQAAYCKYCYRTHDDWERAEDHDWGCWTCRLCDHTSHEQWMRIYLLTPIDTIEEAVVNES